jgi:hypothetical protein
MYLIDSVTMGDFRGNNDGHFCNTNRKHLKSVTSMELGQCHIVKLLPLNGLKLQEIATELSSASIF